MLHSQGVVPWGWSTPFLLLQDKQLWNRSHLGGSVEALLGHGWGQMKVWWCARRSVRGRRWRLACTSRVNIWSRSRRSLRQGPLSSSSHLLFLSYLSLSPRCLIFGTWPERVVRDEPEKPRPRIDMEYYSCIRRELSVDFLDQVKTRRLLNISDASARSILTLCENTDALLFCSPSIFFKLHARQQNELVMYDNFKEESSSYVFKHYVNGN